jgi:hypothetical protein
VKKIITFLILILSITGLMIGCSKDQGQEGNNPGPPPANTCDGVNAKFAADILPILQTRCATGSGCHDNGSINGPGALTNFSQIKNAAGSIKTAVVSGRMPLGGSLGSSQIRQIGCWVDNGALNN